MTTAALLLLATSIGFTAVQLVKQHYRIKTLENMFSAPPLGVRGKCKGGPVKLKRVK